MGNCLKTQLKETVQNDNLEKMGYLRLMLAGNASLQKIRFDGVAVSADFVNVISGTPTITVNSSANQLEIVSESPCVLDIDKKYNIVLLDGYLQDGYNISKLDYAPIKNLNIKDGGCGDIGKLSLTDMIGFSITSNTIGGILNMSTTSGSVIVINAPLLTVQSLGNHITSALTLQKAKVEIPVAEFSNYDYTTFIAYNTDLSYYHLSDIGKWQKASNVNISVFGGGELTEKLVQVWATRKTGTLSLTVSPASNMYVTKTGASEGEKLNGSYSIEFSNGGITITKNGTTVATYNGSTWS